jgi:hypothetical protein
MTTWTTLWNSLDGLSSVINRANWGIAATLFLGFVFTAIVIVAGNRKDALLRVTELEKEQTIAQTKKLSAEANERAAKLELTAEQIRSQNLSLQADLERERIKRLELERQVGFRSFSKEERGRLIGALARARDSVVNIQAPNSSSESSHFAEGLRDVFMAAGWHAGPVLYNIVGGMPIERGVLMIVCDKRSVPGMLVQQTFHTVGTEIKAAFDPRMPEGTVVLVVGQKP